MEKKMLENDDNLVNNNNKNNSKNSLNNEDKRTDSNDGATAKDIISMKSNDMTPNSQDNLPSKTNVTKKSSSTSPSTSVKRNNWISTNPFVNYIRNCQKHDFFKQPDRLNFFQFAGTRWRLMSSKEKQPYVNGAALIKKQRLMKVETATRGQKRKRLSGIMTMKKSDLSAKKGKKDKNKDKKDKKRKKSKRGGKRRKMKRQRLMKNDTESDSDNSPETSDNESVASDEIM